jgi:hypothetical protein
MENMISGNTNIMNLPRSLFPEGRAPVVEVDLKFGSPLLCHEATPTY